MQHYTFACLAWPRSLCVVAGLAPSQVMEKACVFCLCWKLLKGIFISAFFGAKNKLDVCLFVSSVDVIN